MKTVRVTTSGLVSVGDTEIFESVHHTGAITRTLPVGSLTQGPNGTVQSAVAVHICDAEGNAGSMPITVVAGAPGQLINNSTSYVIQSPFQTATFRRTAKGGWSVSDDQIPSDSTFVAPGSSVSRTAVARINDYGVNAADFMSPAQLADIFNGSAAVDVTAAIQSAIDYAMYHGNANGQGGPEIRLPAGPLRISNTIHLGYGTNFRSATLCGAGPRQGGGNARNGSGTALICTFNDRPAIAISGGRGSTVKNLSIYGLNQAHIVSIINGVYQGAPTDPTVANVNPARWVDPTFPASASSQHAPYCGIAIDPYVGARPAVSYPDVTFPAFMNNPGQYGKFISSRTWIDNVIISGFVVGIANQPCDMDSNADFTKITRTEIAYCQYAVSVGNTQARLTSFMSGEIQRCHTGFVTEVHGRRVGKPSLLVQSTEIRLCVYWLDCANTTYGGGPQFVNCYGEAMYAIGKVGTAASFQYPVKFDCCEFSFSLWSYYGVPAYVFEHHGPGFTTFDSCTWRTHEYNGRVGLYGQQKARNYRIVNCQVDNEQQSELYEAVALNATLGLHFNQGSTDLVEYSCRAPSLINLDTGTSLGLSAVYSEHNEGNRERLLPVYSKTARANINDPGFSMPHPEYSVSKAGKAISVNGRDVTIDLGAGHIESRFALMGGDVGDVVWDSESGATFYVMSRTGTTITMRAQTGFDSANALLIPITTDGSLYLLNCRKYTPQYVTYCATSSSSAAATSVQRDDGFKVYISSEMPVGDWLWVDPEVDHYIPSASAKIAAVDATAGTLTASGNFRRTESRVRLKLFVRAAPPNSV